MDLFERVKYERVSKSLRRTLLTLWRHQSRLKINFNRIFYESDMSYLEADEYKVTHKLLKRTTNLIEFANYLCRETFYKKLKLTSDTWYCLISNSWMLQI